MAQQFITEGISGEEAANIINENDAELFTGVSDLEAEQVTQDEAIAVNTAKVGGVNATTVLSGGMAWVSGLTYQSLGLRYEINGTTFIIADGTEVTLDAADGTNPRLDLIYGDDTGILGKSTGTPGATPSANTLESNQLQLTIALVEALATEPTGQSVITVFTEGVGQPAEYDATENTGGARIDVANAVDPITGSIDIKTIANLTTGDEITLIHTDPVLTSSFQYIKLSFLSLRDWGIDFIDVNLYNGATLIATSIINKHIIDVKDLVNVQEVNLFKAAFGTISVTQFTKIVLRNRSTGKILYQLDDIYIGLDTTEGGTTPTVAVEEAPEDGTPYARQDKGWVSAGGGGGGGANYYLQTLWVDSSSVTNFMGIARRDFNNNEYAVNTAIDYTSGSIVNITEVNAGLLRPFFIVTDNQTINSLETWAGWESGDNFKKIALAKIVWTDIGTFESITELCDVEIIRDASGYFSIPDSAFTETSLTDGDMVYMFFGTDTINDVAPISINLKTTND